MRGCSILFVSLVHLDRRTIYNPTGMLGLFKVSCCHQRLRLAWPGKQWASNVFLSSQVQDPPEASRTPQCNHRCCACAADAPESPETPAHNQEHISFPNNQSAIAFPEQEKLLEEYGRGIASVSYSLAQPQPQPQPQPQTRPQSVVRADLSTQNSAAASSLLQRRFQEFQQTQPTIMRQELAPSSPARPAPESSFCTLSSGTLAAGTTQPVAILPCARPDCRTIKAIAQAMRVKLKESEEEVRILQNELRTTPHETKRRAGDNELMACLH